MFEKNKPTPLSNQEKDISIAIPLLFQNVHLKIADELLSQVERLYVFWQLQFFLLLPSNSWIFHQYNFPQISPVQILLPDNSDAPDQYHKTDNPVAHQLLIHKQENNKPIRIL